MGALCRIKIYARDISHARLAMRLAFDRIAALDRVLSDYRAESELNQLCKSAPLTPVAVSSDLLRLLIFSQYLAQETDGAFDITCGSLTHLWRKARRDGRLPEAETIRQAVAVSGYRHLQIDETKQTVTLAGPGIQLDAGGIGKGYAADEALALLRQLDISSALIDMSGGLACSGPPPGEPGWRVRLPDASVLLLANAAVATSGDAEQNFTLDAACYSHLLDPRTGAALTDSVAATVIASTGIFADGLSTAARVLGPIHGSSLVKRAAGGAALIICRTAHSQHEITGSKLSIKTCGFIAG